MFLRRYGRPASTTIVLLHGVPGSASIWDGVVERLALHYDVVVPDLLGFGRSPRPGALHPETHAAALGDALEREKIEHAAVVGHDFGGPIALSLYRQRPRLFTSLALMATNAFPDTPIPFPLNTVNLPIVGDLMARVLFSSPALKQLVHRNGGTDVGDVDSVRRIFTHTLRNLDKVFSDYPATLAEVTVPAMVLWGGNDPFFAVSQAERTASLLPDVDFRILRGAGHFLPSERPGDVADALMALVSRTETDAPAEA